MNRMKMKLIPLIIIVSFFGCSKDSSTSPNTCDTSYSGTWALTSTGSYENGDCTGDLTVSTIDDGSIYLVLSDDCTATLKVHRNYSILRICLARRSPPQAGHF